MPDYADNLVRQILQYGGSDWDFELFCARHYSNIEGFSYLPTSKAYDLGADGQTVRTRGERKSYIIASMQENRIEEKAIDDLKTLLRQRNRPAKVRLCFAMLKTEHTRHRIEKLVKKVCGSVEYEVSGITQLAEEVHRHLALSRKRMRQC
jgi:hypothetical protein